jgi:ribosomal protein S6
VVYELATLVDPKLSEDKVDKLFTSLGDTVAQGSGAVLSSGEPRLRNLAYEITVKTEGKRRDYKDAYFNWIKFKQDPELISDLESTIKANKSIIRFLIIKTTREDFVTTLTDEYNPDEEEFEDESDDEESEGEDNTEPKTEQKTEENEE